MVLLIFSQKVFDEKLAELLKLYFHKEKELSKENVSKKTELEFEKFYSQTSNLLYNYILKRVRDNEKSLDIMQNAYLKTYPEFTKLEFPKSYLYKVAYHMIIDNTNKTKREIELKETLEIQTEHSDRNQFLRIQIDKALDKLKQKDRDVFELKTFQEFSYKQISVITGLTPKAVESVLTRVRNFLRDELKNLREFGYLRSLTECDDEQVEAEIE